MSEKIKEILKQAEELESSGKIMDAIKKYEEAIEKYPALKTLRHTSNLDSCA